MSSLGDFYVQIKAQLSGGLDDVIGEVDGIGEQAGEQIGEGIGAGAADAIDFSAVSQSLDSLGDSMADVGGSMSKGITAPLAAVGGGALLAAGNVGDYADSILDASDITGMSTDSMQEWEYVARQAGVAPDVMQQSTRRLTQRLDGLTESSDENAQMFADMGLSHQDWINLDQEDKVDSVIDGLADMEDETQRNVIANEMFGRGWADLAPILGGSSEDIAELRDQAHDLGGVMDEDGLNTANDYRMEMDQLQYAMRGLWNEVALALIPVIRDDLLPIIRDFVIPAVQSFAETLAGLIEWFTSLDPATRRLVLGLAGLAAAIGPLLLIGAQFARALATITRFLTPILNVITRMVPGFNLLAGAFTRIIPMLTRFAGPIGIAVTALTLLWNRSEAFREALGTLGETVLSAGTRIWEALAPVFERIGELVGELTGEGGLLTRLIDLIVEILEPAFVGLVDTITIVFDTVVSVIEAALGVIQGILDVVLGVITGDWSRAWEGVRTIAASLWSGITSVISGAINGISSLISGILSTISNIWSAAWQDVSAFASSIWSGIVSIASSIWSGLVSTLTGFVDNIVTGVQNGFELARELATSAVEGLRDSVTDTFENVVSFVGDIPGNIMDALGDLSTFLTDSGSALIDGFTDGITSAFSGAVSAVTDGLSGLRDLLPFSPAKEGPFSGSGYTLYSGEALMKDFGEGIASQADHAADAAADTAAEVTDAMDIGQLPADIVPDYVPEDWTLDTTTSNAAALADEPAAAGAGDGDESDPLAGLTIQGPLVELSGDVRMDSDRRTKQLAQELYNRAQQADRSRGRVQLAGVTE